MAYTNKLIDGDKLGYLIGKIKTLVGTKIDNPATKSSGNFLKYDGTNWVAADVPESGVLTVTAGDASITIGGTASNPTVAAKLTGTQGNVTLSTETDGLKANIASLNADLITDGTTNKAFTAAEKTKLGTIAEGAEVNVNANWTETDTTSDAYIQNKPTLGTAAAKNFTSAVTEDSTDLVTSGAVHTAISGLTGFHFEIVAALPTTGQTNIIYLVLKSSGETGNIYTEWAWINNAYEKLGDTQLTLEYLTNSEIDAIWNAN